MVGMAHNGTAADRFERWLSDEFVTHNTELEEAYLAAGGRHDPDLAVLQQTLALDGAELIARLTAPPDPVAAGVSNPLAANLLGVARTALDDVLASNRALSECLDVDRFFFSIRPYFKPYEVGGVEYRGANAGDFAAINEIGLLLGLCRPDDPFYQHVLTEKYAYVPPEDQPVLRRAVTGVSLLEQFLEAVRRGPVSPELTGNANRFLEVCRAHGAAYTFHHHRLVEPLLEQPAKAAPPDGITASGPPLDVVIRGLERLSDLRAARDRPGDPPTARASLDHLRRLLPLASGGQADGVRLANAGDCRRRPGIVRVSALRRPPASRCPPGARRFRVRR